MEVDRQGIGVGGGGGRGERDLNVREGQEGRGVEAKKTFLNWFRSLIRSHGKKTQTKSFFDSL